MASSAGRDTRHNGWALLEELPALACVIDGGGNILFANSRWRGHFPDAAAELSETLCALAEEGFPNPRERRVRLRDARGRLGWYELCAQTAPALPQAAGCSICVASAVDEAQRYDLYLAILADASDALANRSDVEEALRAIARLVVPDVADVFALYRPGPAGAGVVPRFVYHRSEAEAAAALTALGGRGPSASAAARVAASGAAEQLTGDTLEFGWAGALVVPVAGREERWGVLQFAIGPAGGRLGAAEMRLARELARRAGAAFDNAALLDRSERAADDMRFLAGVGETMLESLELEVRLDRFVHAVVPRLADWATVNLLQDDGTLETVAIAHADPKLLAIAERLRGRYNGDEDASRGTPLVLRTGRAHLMTGVDDEALMHEHIRPESLDDVRALGARAAFIVPLAAHGRIYGTLSAMRGAAGPPFWDSDMWLIEELARRAAVGIAHAKLFRRSADVADAFQQASLPDTLPVVPGMRFSAFYAPGRREATVGGDWYDAFTLADGRVVISIGDVSGSGLAAAVIMGSVRQVIRGAAQLDADPRVILDATDRALRSEYPEIVVTAFVAVVDRDRRQLAYASAGHPPPLVRTPAGEIVEMDSVGLPLGLREHWEAPEQVLPLEPGSLLLFYTDGLIESTRNLLQGQTSLQRALRNPRVLAAANVALAVCDAVLPDGASDDVAILAAHVQS